MLHIGKQNNIILHVCLWIIKETLLTKLCKHNIVVWKKIKIFKQNDLFLHWKSIDMKNWANLNLTIWKIFFKSQSFYSHFTEISSRLCRSVKIRTCIMFSQFQIYQIDIFEISTSTRHNVTVNMLKSKQSKL